MQEGCQGAAQGRGQTPPWGYLLLLLGRGPQLQLVLQLVLLLVLLLQLLLRLPLLPRRLLPALPPLPQHGWPPLLPPAWLLWGLAGGQWQGRRRRAAEAAGEPGMVMLRPTRGWLCRSWGMRKRVGREVPDSMTRMGTRWWRWSARSGG